MIVINIGVVVLLTGGIMIAALAYLRRVRMDRPPIGVINNSDLVFLIAVVATMPFAYLSFPTWLVATFFTFFGTGLMWMTLSPWLGAAGRWLALGIASVNVGLAVTGHSHSLAFNLINGLAICLMVVGAANAWVQGGVRSRSVAMIAGLIAVYDLLATWLSPVTLDFFLRVRDLPFTPVLMWGTGDDMAGAGLGDILIAALWVAVVDKAFGRRAVVSAFLLTWGLVPLVYDPLLLLGLVPNSVAVMVMLGPVIVAQYVYFSRRYGPDRTFAEYSGAASGTLGLESLVRPRSTPETANQ